MNPEILTLIEKLKHLLTYQPDEAFVFSGLEFWIFLSVFLLAFSVSYQKTTVRNLVFVLFSLFFYYKSSGFAVGLLLFTITEDFFIARYIALSKSQRVKRALVTLSIVSNLLVLAYFKYTYFFIDMMNSLFPFHIQKQNWLATLVPHNSFFNPDLHAIILPVGISFFTFQSLSYTIDVYRGQIKPLRHWLDFAFFASFFPQLVAGPIVRAKDFIGQIYKPYQVDRPIFGKGVFLILSGLVKKIVISDVISTQLVDRVFDQPELATALETWLAVYGYGLQIFCDFSGYTDIAIGLALILGFQLNPNFDQPYKSVSITEFWRRWHISLSVWLRDYLYIPLGGNRKGSFRTYLNLFITMLLGGLWHGANVKFILWGGLHGLALAFHKLWMQLCKKLGFSMPALLAWLLTFHFALLCWVPFRAADMQGVVTILTKLTNQWDVTIMQPIILQYRLPLVLLIFGFGLHFLPDGLKKWITGLFERAHPALLCLLSAVAVFVIYQFKTAESQPFIYFQF